ncbi:hypothetical protein Dimus_008644 [Dionaea muscipula]
MEEDSIRKARVEDGPARGGRLHRASLVEEAVGQAEVANHRVSNDDRPPGRRWKGTTGQAWGQTTGQAIEGTPGKPGGRPPGKRLRGRRASLGADHRASD